MISALCPSRGRPEMLVKSLASLRECATGEVELMVAADNDDPATALTAEGLGARVLRLERTGYGQLGDYYNALAMGSTGDWLLVWSDDAVMFTPGFDAVIENMHERYLIADLQNPHTPLCCFPAVHRKAMEALGRFCTPNPHVDTFWQDIGYATRTIHTVQVRVGHDRPDITGRLDDQTSREVSASHRTADFYAPAHQAEMAECINIIRARFPVEE